MVDEWLTRDVKQCVAKIATNSINYLRYTGSVCAGSHQVVLSRGGAPSPSRR